jgi:hypothetical protein
MDETPSPLVRRRKKPLEGGIDLRVIARSPEEINETLNFCHGAW